MIDLHIEEKDVPVLKEILNKYLVDLRREYSRTENKEWQADLEAEETLMNNLLQQLAK